MKAYISICIHSSSIIVYFYKVLHTRVGFSMALFDLHCTFPFVKALEAADRILSFIIRCRVLILHIHL